MQKKYNLLLLTLAVLFSTTLMAQQDFTVHFEGHSENFEKNWDAAKKASPEEITTDYYVRYLQFEQLPDAKKRAKMEAQGLQFIAYIDFGAYLTAIPKDFDLGSLASESLRAVQPVKTDWKIDANLKHESFEPWAYTEGQVEVLVQVYPFVNIDDAAQLLEKAGYVLSFIGRQGHWIQTRLWQSDFEKLAEQNFVQHVELISAPGEPEDNRGSALHRSNMINSDSPMGKKYDGTGVSVLVRDDGIVGPHIDFEGRLINLASDNSDVEHADGVAGIFGGAGNVDPYMKGMASGATVYVIDYVNHFQDNTLDLHLNEGVKVTNSSYSDGCNDGYTQATRTVDKQIFDNPSLIHVFSAGNSGTLNCGYGAGNVWGNITGGHKQGKNCITTANLGQDFVLENSSSRGPAHDGRIKPDISANGFEHFSTDPNNAYSEFGGTSAAAPAIAGCATQLIHAYKTLTGETEAPTALIKAAILNTANDLGNVGPDYRFGWGAINAHRALGVLEKNQYWKNSVDNDAMTSQTISISAGQAMVRFMLYWAEKESAPGSARALINDLDLLVIAPNGDTLMPWVLNPAANATTLNAPATRGRDHLNNMEQVAVFAPEAGDYTILVNGHQVPLGPQEYYIVFDSQDAKPTVTFPNGGEGFRPGEVVRVHWDAYDKNMPATLDYTYDDGATWNSIATASAGALYYDWPVPQFNRGNMKVRVTVGMQSDTSDFGFTIVREPNIMLIDKVCPDSMFLRIVGVVDTLTYDVYLLGENYMELAGNISSANYGFPISNPEEEKWVSIAPKLNSGWVGARIRAKRHGGGLRNCAQQFDVSALNLLEPMSNTITACSAFSQDISIQIQNAGLDALTGITASYQFGNQTVVTENVPDLAIGEMLDFAFAAPAIIDTNGVVMFKAWVNATGDVHGGNDTLFAQWNVVTKALDMPFVENFEHPSQTFPPANWKLVNPDNGITWQDASVTGIDNTTTTAAMMDFYNYNASTFQEDFLYTPPLDLSNFTEPALQFDLAYAKRLIPGRDDALRIEAYANCDLNAEPIVLYRKTGDALKTVNNNAATSWQPVTGSHWRTDLVSLKALNGSGIIRIVAENDLGNRLYVDNFNFTNTAIMPTEASFTVSADTICKGESVNITNNSTGEDLQYAWSFTGANPSGSGSAGPHTTTYGTAGDKTIQLVLGGAGGFDTLNYPLFVFDTPTASFTADAMNSSVTFTNTSAFGETFEWDFGDGTTSTETNPTHIFAVDGVYSVSLVSTNRCGTSTLTEMLDLMTINTTTLSDRYKISTSPNPTKGAFTVFFEGPKSEEVDLFLTDVSGRIIEQKTYKLNANTASSLEMGSRDLPNGVYSLRLKKDNKEKVFKVVVQH